MLLRFCLDPVSSSLVMSILVGGLLFWASEHSIINKDLSVLSMNVV